MNDNRELQEQDDGDDRVLPTADTDPAPAPARRVTVPVAPSRPSSSRPRSNHAAAPGPPISHSTLDPASMDHEELGDFLDDEYAMALFDEEDRDLDTTVALDNNPEAFAIAMEMAASLAAGLEVDNIISTDAAPRAPATASAVPGPRISHSTQINDFLDHYSSQPDAALDMEFDMDLDMSLLDDDLDAPLLLDDDPDAFVFDLDAPVLAPGLEVDNLLSTEAPPRAPAATAALFAYSANITVEIAGGAITLLDLAWPTVGLIKRLISAHFNPPVPVKVLRAFIGSDEIKDDEHLVFAPWRVRLSTVVNAIVQTLNDLFAIDIDAFDTVAHLRESLQQASGGELPVATTTIMFEGEEMEDDRRLATFWEIEMADGTKIPNPRLPGVTFGVTAVRKDHQQELESFFRQWIEPPAAASQPSTEQQQAIEASSQPITDLIEVNLVLPGGQTLPLKVCPTDNVDAMRPRFAEMVAQLHPPEYYTFEHGGHLMEGHEQILRYNVRNGDNIKVILK